MQGCGGCSGCSGPVARFGAERTTRVDEPTKQGCGAQLPWETSKALKPFSREMVVAVLQRYPAVSDRQRTTPASEKPTMNAVNGRVLCCTTWSPPWKRNTQVRRTRWIVCGQNRVCHNGVRIKEKKGLGPIATTSQLPQPLGLVEAQLRGIFFERHGSVVQYRHVRSAIYLRTMHDVQDTRYNTDETVLVRTRRMSTYLHRNDYTVYRNTECTFSANVPV